MGKGKEKALVGGESSEAERKVKGTGKGAMAELERKGKGNSARGWSSPRLFKKQEVQQILNAGDKIGSGNYGKVYKGDLENQTVAVKKVEDNSEYLREKKVLEKLDHQSIVKMIGFCDSLNCLVLEFMNKGSLHRCLHAPDSPQEVLDWTDRFKIAVGVAEGLMYLHHDLNPALIHRDIKPENVLLDDKLNVKIADLGLAVTAPKEGSCRSPKTADGTPGYICPDYLKSGKLSTKCDIYSYGMLLLEILTGRKVDQPKADALKEEVFSYANAENKDYKAFVDPKLTSYDKAAFQRLVDVSVLCLRDLPAARPNSKELVAKLKGFDGQIHK